MPTIVGKVKTIEVTTLIGKVVLSTEDHFVLWAEVDLPSPAQRIIHSMWVSLISRAIEKDLNVKIFYDAEDNHNVTGLELISV